MKTIIMESSNPHYTVDSVDIVSDGINGHSVVVPKKKSFVIRHNEHESLEMEGVCIIRKVCEASPLSDSDAWQEIRD